MKMLLVTAAMAGLMNVATGAQAADEKVMMILDESGSMWGQIDGKAKIEIAREVIAGLLNDWSANAQLGVMAYGHREKGSCDDIELIAPVGKVDAPALIGKINALKPKGKTPIAGALKQAATALKSTEEKATVLLLSDGLETCDADPCLVASELEKAGVDFTAHVVGFDLKDEELKQLKCIADNTGGLMLSASNASELNDALGKVVEKVAQAEPIVEEAPKSRLIFEEKFDNADMVMANFEIKNEDDEAYLIEEGKLILISAHKGDNPYVPNSFQLSRALPEGDWTVSMIFEPATGSNMDFGFQLGDPTNEEKVKSLFAGYVQYGRPPVNTGLWMTNGEKKSADSQHLGVTFDRTWEGVQQQLGLDHPRFELQLSRTGRDYTVRTRGISKDGSYKDWMAQRKLTVLKPFKQLRIINAETTANNAAEATYAIHRFALYEGTPE